MLHSKNQIKLQHIQIRHIKIKIKIFKKIKIIKKNLKNLKLFLIFFVLN